MRHIFLLLLAFTLFACGAAPDELGELGQEKLDIPTALTETETNAVSDSAESPTTEPETKSAEAIAKPDQATRSFEPATNPAEAQQLRANDHFIGATDPDVVLVEYSDFQ